MPRKYIGPFDLAELRHPVTGVQVVVQRDVPTDELDDAGDLGPEWVDLGPAPDAPPVEDPPDALPVEDAPVAPPATKTEKPKPAPKGADTKDGE